MTAAQIAGTWLNDNTDMEVNVNRYHHYIVSWPYEDDGELVITSDAELIEFARSKGWGGEG